MRNQLLILLFLLPFSFAQPPAACYQRVDHQRGDVVPWTADIHDEFYKTIRVVSGVSLQERVLFSWRLPRNLSRGCVSEGFDLEVMHACQLPRDAMRSTRMSTA